MSAEVKEEIQPDTPAQEADVFSEAFEKLAEMADVNKPNDAVPAAEEKTEAAPKPASEKPAAEVEEQAKPADEPTQEEQPSEEAVAEETQSAAQEAAPTTEISDEDLLARFASLVRKAEPVAESQPVQSRAATPEPEIFSSEEKQILTDYEKDWPDVAKAEALRRKAEYRELVGYVFSEVAKELRPVLNTVQTMAVQTHLSDLQTTIPDYNNVRDKVIEWVAQQPAYLQPAYQHVIQQGTVDEVHDLVERYRSATGASAPSALRAAPRKGSELPQATKQAAASLAPVSSKRSAVIQGVDQGDFDSAFAAFADKM